MSHQCFIIDGLDEIINLYQYDIDGARNIACTSPVTAFLFAKYIEKRYHKQTREAVCLNPYLALQYAIEVDICASDITRQACSLIPSLAFTYAAVVDKKSHSITKEACIHSKEYVIDYALRVEQGISCITTRNQSKMFRKQGEYMELIDNYPFYSNSSYNKKQIKIFIQAIYSYLI